MHFTDNVIGRWVAPDMASAGLPAIWRAVRSTVLLTLLLLIALAVNKYIQDDWTSVWMVLVTILAVGMMGVRYAEAGIPAVRLMQWLGALSAVYGVLHYPIMPVLNTTAANFAFVMLWIMWVVSTLCGLATFRWPSLGLIPAAYLIWSLDIARTITGLNHNQSLDVAPLAEVALCIGVGLAILACYGHRQRVRPSRNASLGVDTVTQFAQIVLLFAISIHVANYFWSALAKLTLHGPILSWVWLNNPLYIYLSAADDGHITFSDYALASRWVATFIDATHIPSNIFVLLAQIIAVGSFLMSKRWFIALLLAFDVMHLGIAIAAGANFWPWILLNGAIAATVMRKRYVQPPRFVGLLAAGFIMISPLFANVALLGWYDSGANNNTFFQAEDESGQRYYVSPNYFTFYSYPFAHMVYGTPQPDSAFALGDPNGGTRRYYMAKAGLTCDVNTLTRPGAKKPPHRHLDQFVRDYHLMAMAIERRIGVFPYNLYPHHFYVRPSRMTDFYALDKRRVVAYIMRRESVCLSLINGVPRRRLISTGEYRIDMPHD